MGDNSQKTPFVKSLDSFTRERITSAVQLYGKQLPCSVVEVDGSIVTVKFELDVSFTLPHVQMPVIGSEYVRLPIQPGCKGFAVASDAYLGGMSGLGTGVADLRTPGNLAALVFAPIGNVDFFPVDPNSAVIYGPNGVTLQDTGGHSTVILTPGGIVITGQNSIQLIAGTAIYLMDAMTGTVTLTAPGGFIVNGDAIVNGALVWTGVASSGGASPLQISGGMQNTSGDISSNGHTLSGHTHISNTPGNPTSTPTG